jgi:hypothetical protein
VEAEDGAGRKRKANDDGTDGEGTEAVEIDTDDESDEDDKLPVPPPKRKRGRPSKAAKLAQNGQSIAGDESDDVKDESDAVMEEEEDEHEHEHEHEPPVPALKRKRGRPSNAARLAEIQNGERGSVSSFMGNGLAPSPVKRGRGRPKKYGKRGRPRKTL